MHRFQRKGTCQMGLDIRNSTPTRCTRAQGAAAAMSCQQYSAPMRELGHALFPEVKSTPSRSRTDTPWVQACPLPEISDVQPGRLTHPHTAGQLHMILGPPPLTLLDVHPGVPTSCRLKYPNPPGLPRPPITERMRDEAHAQAIRARFVVGSLAYTPPLILISGPLLG